MIGYRSNINSLIVQRNLGNAASVTQRARERLASGLRINKASDDAAGLAIAESLKADTRLSTQAVRNVNDAISLLQIADGALETLSSIITRGAELSNQAANGVYSNEQRQPLNDEAQALIDEIDRIVGTTQFNGLKLLQSDVDPLAADKQEILIGLQSSWLEQSEDLIQTYYGIVGDGAPLNVTFVNGDAQYLAAVSGTSGAGGLIYNQQLIVDVADFVPATLPNGGTAPYYDDRIIAHEMVHAVMGRTMNFSALPTWFIEGTAEFIHGADERVAADVSLNGGAGTGGEIAVANQIDQTWTGSSLQYSAGYSAVRYLHSRIITAGGAGIKDVIDYLVANPTDDLDDALQNITNGAYSGTLAASGGFYEDFKPMEMEQLLFNP
jgi:flagellin